MKKIRNVSVRARDKAAPTKNIQHGISVVDAFRNPLARLGYDTPNILEYTEYHKTNLTAKYNTLTVLYRENWIVKRLVDVVAEDMVKNWYRINSQLPHEKKRQLTKLERRTRLRSKILDGLKWGRLYGGAAAIIIIDGHEDILDKPLDYDFIMPGSFKGLIVVDRWSGISTSPEIVEDINDPDFGLPKYYEISADGFGKCIKVHHSRVIRFTGRRMPYIEEVAETYWGTSEIEHIFAEIKKYDNTSYNIASLVFSANLKVYVMDGYEQMMAGANPEALTEFYNTMAMMNWMMSSNGMQIIGQKDQFVTHPYSFGGLSDIYEMFMLDVSGASGIPVTKLFGRSPAGMNARGESDMANYYDSIEEQQEASLRPVIDKLLPVMCLSEFGAIPDDLEFEFEPVRRPSEEERKNILTQTTSAIVQAFQANIISQSIALKELRESSRTTGMWNNITDEDIEKANTDFGMGEELVPPDIMGFSENEMSADEGNENSGNHNHKGRPGEVGGSAKGEGSAAAGGPENSKEKENYKNTESTENELTAGEKSGTIKKAKENSKKDKTEKISKAESKAPSKTSNTESKKPVSSAEGENTPCTGFANNNALETHYIKHLSELGFESKEEYQKKGIDFLKQACGGDVIGYSLPDGKVVRFNKATTEYASGYPGSRVCTFMKPKYNKKAGKINPEKAMDYYIRNMNKDKNKYKAKNTLIKNEQEEGNGSS